MGLRINKPLNNEQYTNLSGKRKPIMIVHNRFAKNENQGILNRELRVSLKFILSTAITSR